MSSGAPVVVLQGLPQRSKKSFLHIQVFSAPVYEFEKETFRMSGSGIIAEAAADVVAVVVAMILDVVVAGGTSGTMAVEGFQ
jgi:hypothetical protein